MAKVRLIPGVVGIACGALLAACDEPLAQVGLGAPSGLRDAVQARLTESQMLATLRPGERLVSAQDTDPGPCPQGMVLVEGSYCPVVQHNCLEYLDGPGPYEHFRCARYSRTVQCVAKRVTKRFCIDRDEYAEPGATLPANFRSFTHAEKLCRAQGKRVCRESEWNFACEGEEMRPYPYGFVRDPTACNADNFDLVNDEGKLKDLRAPSHAYPRCVSPFGVRNLAGNLEEFVAMDYAGPPVPAMKGAYWQPSRNFCRAAQTAHDRYYNGMETGFRCCADP